MNNTLYVDDGSVIYLDPRYKCSMHELSYIISSSNDPELLIIKKSFENTITVKCANELIKKDIAHFNRSKIFSNPKLCESIFKWNFEKEIQFILNIYNKYSYVNILDLACGHGRLLLPLHNKNIDIWGIDSSFQLITFLKSKVSNNSSAKLICADISEIIMPNQFDFAYAAMNSLRYIDSYFLLKKHFVNMAHSFKTNGRYIFQVTISSDININYHNKWDFEYEGKGYNITWEKFSECRIFNYIIDRVVIVQDDKIQTVEYQKQLFLNKTLIYNLLNEIKSFWSIEKIYNSNFIECLIDDNSNGNFWFVLVKK